ncbi:MAG TPA: CDP-alcohol phosphatidyltransferase family protein [Caulobacteraceae bacterium]|jgi:phosphatidylglycerophosphate synthase|nr:CDP-alcohol phosphatidyltransferase family protein [Caulobacteraceae bacterium]
MAAIRSPSPADSPATRALASVGIIVGDSPVRLWGMTPAERLRRTLARAGVPERQVEEAPAGGSALVLRGDWVFDESLVRALAARPGLALAASTGEAVAAHVAGPLAATAGRWLQGGDAGAPPPGLVLVGAEALVSDYNVALRKREPAMLVRLTRESAPAVEARMFGGSYKGVTDFVTKHVWPAPAKAVTRQCAQAGITPNQVTLLSAVLTVAAFVLFWRGAFGWGLACAWAMTFLDTVDGKLARVTLTSSKWGNVFDHGLDLVHPPFWWWAWIVGLQAGATPLADPGPVLAVVVAGYVAQRLQEGLFLARHRLEIHIWRRFDSRFRLVTARRNPNLAILTLATAAGRPDLGMAAVAVWTVASFAVHAVQIVQAEAARRRGPIVSWMAG